MIRFLAAIFPLLLVPALGFLIAEGHLDLGGGEKDLIWVLPYTLWSLLFFLSSIVLWVRGRSLLQATRWSAILGVIGVLAAGLVLALFGQLGVGGRF